jgi:thiol-disulfide isomerase/thioredoxin
MLWLAASVLTPCLSAGGARAAAPEIKIGDRIDNLSFKDIRYLPRSLDDFGSKKAFVLVFTNTTCPVVQRYLPALKAMDKEYRGQGVQFLAINVGEEDSIVGMAAQAVKYRVEFPFVKDFDGTCARAVGARRTPEVVVLDGQRTLRYRGRIDDQYRLGGTKANPGRRDLKEAIADVLAGRNVRVKETPVDGCLITFPEARKPKMTITYAEHVAPLIQKHCQECHRPDTPAPFSLLTYKQVVSKGETIAEVVAEQRMPPWYASPEFRHFVNRRGLTPAERDLIVQWVRAGMPLGDESKLPKPKPVVNQDGQWLIGKPDMILNTKEENLPASGDIPYKYVVLPHVFQEDTWVQGVQILPSNRRTVHHCNMAYFNSKEGFSKQNFVTGYVPGGSAMLLSHGVAVKIPKGSTLVLQIHFVTTGKEEKCHLSVGLKYAAGLIQKRIRFVLLENRKFAIPPGASAHPVIDNKVLDEDSIGIGLFAHMHLRGKDMIFKAHYPNGKSETLLVIPNYSFDWQMPYAWAPGAKKFPKGTRIECIAHYDNSAFNPYNPDPKATVKDGPQTYHEMHNGFMFFIHTHEKLNLVADPKTGRAHPKEDAASSE